jgi:hypothetical protein
VGGQPGLLDRATAMLDKNRKEAKEDNAKIQAENDKIRAENEQAADRAAARDRSADAALASNGGAGGDDKQKADKSDASTKGEADAPKGNADAQKGDGAEASGPVVVGGDPGGSDIQPPAKKPDRLLARANREKADAAANKQKEKSEEAVPSFAVMATYEIKQVRQRGVFRIDLNKYTTDNLSLRFDENIGDLRGLMGDAGHFRQVNLDDPLYKQREIVVFVDGFNAADFGQFVNFASVKLRKKHGSGVEGTDEVRVDRNNFSAQGNQFKLMYGWDGDTDRRKWLDYEYQPTWSFFGGRTIEGAWQAANAGAISLAPPLQRHIVDLQADPDAITSAGVRSITVKLYYDLGAGEQVKQVTLNASKGQLSDKLEFLLPAGKGDYGYEIQWRMKGDRVVTSGRRTGSETVLFVDEVKQG